MKIIHLFIGILLVQFFISCGCSTKTVTCDVEDITVVKNWFMFDSGKVLIYKNQLNNIDTFVMNKEMVFRDNITRFGGAIGSTGICNTNYSIQNLQSLNSFGLNYTITKTKPNNLVTKKTSIHFNQNFFPFGEIGLDTLYKTSNFLKEPLQYVTNQTMANGITYPLVYTVENDTSIITTNIVYKLYLAKNAGVIAYETFPNHDLWVIQ